MKRFQEPILVTRPYLPPLDDFRRGCEEIWRGPFYMGISDQLAEHLGCQPSFDVRERWRYRW